MYQDYKDLLSAFHAHGVRYLIMGGYAMIFHAQPRVTRDIEAYFISKDDLIAAKLASGRPQDLADVSAIQNGAGRYGQFAEGRSALSMTSTWIGSFRGSSFRPNSCNADIAALTLSVTSPSS